MNPFIQNKVVEPLMRLLNAGVTPERLAWSLAAGCLVGVFPLLGVTSLVCIPVAFIFRLNQVAIQITNWLVYPLQFVLIIPLMQWGDRLFGKTPLPLSFSELTRLFKQGFGLALQQVGASVLHAMVLWVLVAIPISYVFYRIFRPLVLHLMKKKTTDSSMVDAM